MCLKFGTLISGDQLAEQRNGLRVILRAENGGSGDEDIHPGIGYLLDRAFTDTAVHFNERFQAPRFDYCTQRPYLVQGAGDELLSAETGVYPHQHDKFQIVQLPFEG